MNIHGTKEITIDDLPQVGSFTTTVEFCYCEENGYEEDKSIKLTENWQSDLLSLCLANYRAMCKHVEAAIEDRYEDVPQWAAKESSLQAEDAAITRYENSRRL